MYFKKCNGRKSDTSFKCQHSGDRGRRIIQLETVWDIWDLASKQQTIEQQKEKTKNTFFVWNLKDDAHAFMARIQSFRMQDNGPACIKAWLQSPARQWSVGSLDLNPQHSEVGVRYSNKGHFKVTLHCLSPLFTKTIWKRSWRDARQ